MFPSHKNPKESKSREAQDQTSGKEKPKDRLIKNLACKVDQKQDMDPFAWRKKA